MTAEVFGDALPTLETPRLRLRQVREEDDARLLAIFGDPEAMRYWSSEPFDGPAAATAYRLGIERGLRDRTLFQWGIATRDDDRLIGTVTIYGWHPAHRRAELGYMLDRHEWGQGLASEAVHAVLDFAFETMQIHRMEADVDPDNEASMRLLERLGFTRDGYMRDRWFTYGEWRDSVLFGLLAEDFAG